MSSDKLFQIGDHVAMINDVIEGKVLVIHENLITIQCDDGFEYTCPSNEFVKTGNLNNYLNDWNHKEFLKENSSIKKRPTGKKTSFKKNNLPALEVDLHIDHLLKTTRGMTNYDILNYQLDTAKKQLEFSIRKNIQKVIFIHGIGDGVLKAELYYLFKKYAVEINEASYQKYGQGATEVRFKYGSDKFTIAI